MEQSVIVERVEIDELDEGTGLHLADQAHYLSLGRSREGLYAEFCEQSNAGLGVIRSIASGPGGFVITFADASEIRVASTDQIKSARLDTLKIQFSEPISSLDLTSLLVTMTEGCCQLVRSG